jgi:hypothetical protein
MLVQWMMIRCWRCVVEEEKKHGINGASAMNGAAHVEV